MRELIAIDMPAGNEFVTSLKKIWDSQDAVLPLDQRLPQTMRQDLVAQFNASAIINANGEQTKLAGGLPVEQGDALVIATSGSTGKPKGVVHTHESIKNAIVITGKSLHCTAADHWLACLSLAHVGGLSVVLRAMHFVSALTIIDRADQGSISQALRNGATLTSLVPTVLRAVDITGFKTVLIGGAHAPSNLPTNVITTYGSTETMGGVVYNGETLDEVEARIAADSEIQIRSQTLLRCYRDGTDPKTKDNWLSTGDLGEIVEGKLVVHGRKDDLINTGGFKVWPNSVETLIRQIDAVDDVVVAGTLNQKWGSAVTAWIVLDNSRSTLSLEDVRRHVKQSLPDYCAPHKIYLVKEIPRSALGKAQVAELRKLEANP